jgi:hypothetical protein
MPKFRLLPVAVVSALLPIASACGALADTTVANVADTDVTMESVEELMRDEAFLGAGTVDESLGRLPGELFRNVLTFELQRTAWVAEAERWDVAPTAAQIAEAEEQLDAQAATTGAEYRPSVRASLAEYLASQQALDARFAALDPSNEEDLRQLYLGAPGLWDRICVAVARVPAEQIGTAQDALDAGVTIEELPGQVEGVELAADPADQCLPIAQLPESLVRGFNEAAEGENAGPATVTNPGAGESSFLFRVDERVKLSFDDARDELASIAQSLAQQGARPWIALIVSAATVDGRVGSGVETGPDGQPSIVPPEGPLVQRPQQPGPFDTALEPSA